jgi:hypothetical protein
MPNEKDRDALRDALGRFNIEADRIHLIERNALSTSHQNVIIHETDRTPVIFDPDLGGDAGPRERCETRPYSMDIGGVASTDRDGRFRWKLSDFICNDPDTSGHYSEPISFVATAMRSTPITMTTRVRNVGDDVEIDVFSWDATGDPAPSVRFGWRLWIVGGGPIVQ